MPRDTFRAGSVQIEPEYHDLEGTIDKTCTWIEKAGSDGLDFVVFPETFVPGYPYWRGCSIARWSELMVDLQKNSIQAHDSNVEVLGDVIADANLHVALGVNELSERKGSQTLYNSIFYFDRSGDLVRRHRKLMPTHEERAIWGRGDPASLATHDTDIGTIGGLICYENHMTLSKAALTVLGEDIHPAVWPGFWEQNGHPGDKSRATSKEAVHTCDIYGAVREYAFETQSFVVSCSAYMSDGAFEEFAEGEIGFNVAAGGSMLVNPAGIVKAGPVFDEETVVTAEFDRDERRATKAYFDAMGHYARWDAVSLRFDNVTYQPVRVSGSKSGHIDISKETIERVAESHDIGIDSLEAIIDSLNSGMESADHD